MPSTDISIGIGAILNGIGIGKIYMLYKYTNFVVHIINHGSGS